MNTYTDILNALRDIEKQEGQLIDSVKLYQCLVEHQSKAYSHCSTSETIPPSIVSSRLAEGFPALTFEDLKLKWEDVQALCSKVTDTVFEHYPSIANRTLIDITCTRSTIQQWYNNSSLVFNNHHNVQEALLNSLIQFTIEPFLSVYVRELVPLINQEQWRRRECPICGSKPDFAFLDKDNGARWLLCSRCNMEWLFQRIECPSCGTQNNKSLSYFTDDVGLYRLYVCEECKSYLKAIDLRQIDSKALFPLTKLATKQMDNQARSMGYQPISSVIFFDHISEM